MVVKRDEALVFNPCNVEVQKFISILQQQLKQSNAKSSELLDGSDSSHQNPEALVSLPFEHLIIETALSLVCTGLATRVRHLEPGVASALNDLRAESRGLDVIQTQVDELLPLKNQLDELRKRAKEMKRAISEVLHSDEDMSMMFLSSASEVNESPPRLRDAFLPGRSSFSGMSRFSSSSSSSGSSKSKGPAAKISSTSESRFVDTMSLEMLFENYLNEIEWVASEVDDILDEVTNTEENVVVQLDLIRNRILRFELMLSISTFVTSCGALLAGLFGMNLVNRFENNPHAFYILTLLTGVAMVTGFRGLVRFAKREKLM